MRAAQVIYLSCLFVLVACGEEGGDVGAHCHHTDECLEGLTCEMDEDGVHGECVETSDE